MRKKISTISIAAVFVCSIWLVVEALHLRTCSSERRALPGKINILSGKINESEDLMRRYNRIIENEVAIANYETTLKQGILDTLQRIAKAMVIPVNIGNMDAAAGYVAALTAYDSIRKSLEVTANSKESTSRITEYILKSHDEFNKWKTLQMKYQALHEKASQIDVDTKATLTQLQWSIIVIILAAGIWLILAKNTPCSLKQ